MFTPHNFKDIHERFEPIWIVGQHTCANLSRAEQNRREISWFRNDWVFKNKLLSLHIAMLKLEFLRCPR